METVGYLEKAKQSVEHESDMEGKYLTFFIEKQILAIPICYIVQIVGMQAITEIPDSAHYMKGIINLRGNIMPVIDIRLRIGKIEKKYDERTCIIAVLIEHKEIGFIVDDVDAVIDIAEENISVAENITEKCKKSYIAGIAKLDNKVVLILNASKILLDDDFMKNSTNVRGSITL